MKLIKLPNVRLNSMSFIKVASFLVILMWGISAFAVEVNDLYQAKVPVSSQSKAERNKALSAAMASVILKVGGQEQVLDNAEIRRSLRQYNQYLTQYRYFTDKAQLMLSASFNESKINQLFQQANLPIWGSLRPQILVWLVDEHGLGRKIISESSLSGLPEIIHQFSEQRGLPLNLPLMDLTDMTAVNTSDLWGRFAEAIKAQSQRYQFDALLLVRISDSSLLAEQQSTLECNEVICQQNSEYILDWSLITEYQKFGEPYQGESKEMLLSQALRDVSNEIYQGYALSSELNNDYILNVANLESMRKYVEVSQFLSELSAVKSVTLIEVNGSVHTFKLNLLGSKNALLASLKLNKKLQQYIDPLADPYQDTIPVFYWSDE